MATESERNYLSRLVHVRVCTEWARELANPAMVVAGGALIGLRAAFVVSKHANGRLPAPVKGQHKIEAA